MRVRFSLRPPKFMNIKNNNNLLELFYNQYTKEKADQIFLKSLKNPNDEFSWRDTYLNILKLSYELKSLIQKKAQLSYLLYLISSFGGRRENRTLTSCETRF